MGNPSSGSIVLFTQSVYTASVPENAEMYTSVVRVTAVGVTGVVYSIDAGILHQAFDINPDSGEISVLDGSLLDYEVQTSVQIYVTARGARSTGSAETIMGFVQVNVSLTDRNDNAPRFTQDRYQSAVWEGNPAGTYVTQIRATDEDSGVFGEVYYQIVSGNEDLAFKLYKENTGIVMTDNILNRATQDLYRLKVCTIHGWNL